MTKKRRWRKNFPYYKIQTYNDIFKSWVDERGAFDTIKEAQEYIQNKVPVTSSSRIIIVNEKKRTVLGEEN